MKSNINNMANEIQKILAEYGQESAEEVKKSVKKVASKTVKKLKETSPKDTGKYAKEWKKTTLQETSRSIAISIHDSKYQLNHLLEKGHQKRGGGRVSPIPHIEPAEKEAVDELEKEIRSRI